MSANHNQQSPDHERTLTLVLGWLVGGTILIVAMAVAPDLIDRYRVVKESISRTEAFLGAFGLAGAFLLGHMERFRAMARSRKILFVIGAGFGWTIVTALLSTHRAHSMESVVTAGACLLIFLTAWYAAPRIPLAVFDVLVVAVLCNVILAFLQETGIYQPFRSRHAVGEHITATALIGNPNIVGTYLALAVMIFVAIALRSHGLRRWWHVLGAFGATAGVLMSQTRTALVALAAGLLLFVIDAPGKRKIIIGSGLALLFALGIALKLPVITQVMKLPSTVARRGVDAATSGRLTPVLAALEMARDRPLTGIGPGTFKYHYMTYKIRITEKHPQWLSEVVTSNFGEVHNDHIQLIAETGAIGYGLFLGAVFSIVRAVRRSNGDNALESVARTMVLPFTGTLLILALAQFPLYVPITRHLVVTMAGILCGWSKAAA